MEAPAKYPMSFYLSVMQEIDKIQNKTSTRRSALLFLGLSIAAFVVAGYFAWDLRFLLFLIPIMFFHELGHFCAMKAFGYRDVKMFFVPLLGAAVAGKNYNIAGWKKVIVYLAGPLPGLVLAIPMAVVAMAWDIELLREIAIMTVLLNALNLLPMVPLDGGRIMHALFFSRNAKLDGALRIVAAIALLTVGVYIGEWFFAVIGGLMLLAVPAVFQNSTIAQTLKSQYGDALVVDSQTIPLEHAQQIVDRLSTEGQQGQTSNLAVRTLQIFEMINCRPPGFASTIALSSAYGAGWVMASAVLVISFMDPQKPIQLNPSDALAPFSFDVPQETVKRVHDTDINHHVNQNVTLRAVTFKHLSDAGGYYRARLSGGAQVAQTGHAVWMIEANEPHNEAASTESNAPWRDLSILRTTRWTVPQNAVFRIEFEAVDESDAQALVRELNVYCQYGALSCAIEPWSPIHSITADQSKARRTLARLMEIERLIDRDDQLLTLLDSDKKKSDPMYRAALQTYTQQADDCRRRLLNEAHSNPENSSPMIDHYVDPKHLLWPKFAVSELSDPASQRPDADQYRQWLNVLGTLLGPLPTLDSHKTPPQDDLQGCLDLRFRSDGGYINQRQARVQLNGISFQHPIDGLPAILKWLQHRRCSNLAVSVINYGTLFEQP